MQMWAGRYQLVVRLPGVLPEDVSSRQLADLMDAVRHLAWGTTQDEAELSLGEEAEPRRPEVAVVSIVRTSAAYRCAIEGAQSRLQHLRLVGERIESKRLDDQTVAAFEPLRELHRICKSLNSSVELRDGKSGDVLARVRPQDDLSDLLTGLVSEGSASVIGTVERIGGATKPRVAIRVPPQQKLLFCGVRNRQLAQELGGLVYQAAELSGQGTWLVSNQRLLNFTVEQFRRLPSTPLAEGFAKLRARQRNPWDNIPDPEAFLRGA